MVVKSSYRLISSISSVRSCWVVPAWAPVVAAVVVESADNRLEIARSGSEGRRGVCADTFGEREVITYDHGCGRGS